MANKQRRAPKVDPEQFFTRVLHRAYMRGEDGIVYTGEALALALLLHAKGKERTRKEVEQIGQMLDDPNIDKR